MILYLRQWIRCEHCVTYNMSSNLVIITGVPGIGKSTFLSNFVQQIGAKYSVGGVVCSDERDADNRRSGFIAKDISNDNCKVLSVLHDASDMYISNVVKVGKWNVNIDNIGSFIVPAMERAIKTKDVIVLDEIAPMQLLSDTFVEFIACHLLSVTVKPTIVTMAKVLYESKDNTLINRIKAKSNMHIDLINRDEFMSIISRIIRHVDCLCGV